MSRPLNPIIREVEYLYDNGHSDKEISSLTGTSMELVRATILQIEEDRFNAGEDNDMVALIDYDESSYYGDD
jgi:hypothetical protein